MGAFSDGLSFVLRTQWVGLPVTQSAEDVSYSEPTGMCRHTGQYTYKLNWTEKLLDV